MYERIHSPKQPYFFENPTDRSKALCIECLRQAHIDPAAQDYLPLAPFDGECHQCGDTLIQAAIRNWRVWQEMGAAGQDTFDLAAKLRLAATAAGELEQELAQAMKTVFSFEEIAVPHRAALLRHQETWEPVCRLFVQNESLTDGSRRVFLSTCLMPILEKYLSRFAVVTVIDGRPWRRIFGRRTSHGPSKVHLTSGPLPFSEGLIPLNPVLDFSPLGIGDVEIHRYAIADFATALDMAAGFAEAAGPQLKADEGDHAWRYLMQFVEQHGIRPRPLAIAINKAGLDKSSVASIELKINARLSQQRSAAAKKAAPKKTKREQPKKRRKPRKL